MPSGCLAQSRRQQRSLFLVQPILRRQLLQDVLLDVVHVLQAHP